jgi:hypothetical protein
MDLACRDLQRNASKGVNPLEALAYVVDCQNRFL